MAQDAVDEAIKTFDLRPRSVALPDLSGYNLAGSITNGSCKTLSTPVLGSHGYSTALAAQLTELYPVLDEDIAHHLATNYGDRAWAVLSCASRSSSSSSAAARSRSLARVSPSFPFIEAELRHAVRSEAACTAADVISRRIRLAFLDVHAALRALPRVIDVLAEELGWTEARKRAEWTATVAFLRSMGLEEHEMGVSRKDVIARGKAMRL
ncbi:hypothetical protein E4U54_004770 [Claviceps lovelessii]|nr:hypothetical protein E4U54_004770 [Claviceps lovelessii]